jgi:hypothetical protein
MESSVVMNFFLVHEPNLIAIITKRVHMKAYLNRTQLSIVKDEILGIRHFSVL